MRVSGVVLPVFALPSMATPLNLRSCRKCGLASSVRSGIWWKIPLSNLTLSPASTVSEGLLRRRYQ